MPSAQLQLPRQATGSSPPRTVVQRGAQPPRVRARRHSKPSPPRRLVRITCDECQVDFLSHYRGCHPLCRAHKPWSPCSPRGRGSSREKQIDGDALALAELLPSDVVVAIAMACTDGSSLAWCGACKSFRASRPPVRVLVVGGDGELADIRHEQPALRHLLAVHVGARGGSLVHRTLAAVSPVHASEVTHLFAAAWRGPGHDLAPSDLSGYGRSFTSLRSVSLAHLTKGTLDPMHPSPAACIKRLLESAAGTLRALSIDAPVFFEAGDAVDVLPSLGARLEALSLVLVPSFLPASLEEELLGPVDGRRLCIRFQQSPGGAGGGTLPAHTLDDEECREFLRWRRDHEVTGRVGVVAQMLRTRRSSQAKGAPRFARGRALRCARPGPLRPVAVPPPHVALMRDLLTFAAQVMEEAQGAGCEMETEYLRQCVHGLCVSLLEPAQVHCHRPPMPLGRRPQLGARVVDEAVAQMATWHRGAAPDAAPLRWPRRTRQLWHIP